MAFMHKAPKARHAKLVGRVSGITLRVGAALLAWSLLLRDDAGHHATVWFALQVVGVVLVLGSTPVYGWYVLTKGKGGSRSQRVLPNQSQIARFLAARRKSSGG
jgi:hypothetical protein